MYQADFRDKTTAQVVLRKIKAYYRCIQDPLMTQIKINCRQITLPEESLSVLEKMADTVNTNYRLREISD